jgi:hypothetical protein
MSEWFESAQKDRENGMSYRAIAEKYGKAYSSVQERFTNIQERPEVVGVIGDTHFPFVHPNYINFLKDTFKKYGVTRIVHIGDLVDYHAISRHQTETDAVDAMTELRLARVQIDLYTTTFKRVDVMLGNHCLIPIRQAATLGIPREFLKGFKELWKLPDGWKVHEQLIISDVLYEHGINALGANGALNKAVNAMQSCVIGHAHSGGGCQYKSNSKSIIFGLNVGCGVDIDAYAFAYGKYSKNRETLGCGIVFDNANAIFVPMGDRYFRRGK